jgi:hypothetical protein
VLLVLLLLLCCQRLSFYRSLGWCCHGPVSSSSDQFHIMKGADTTGSDVNRCRLHSGDWLGLLLCAVTGQVFLREAADIQVSVIQSSMLNALEGLPFASPTSPPSPEHPF